MKKILCTLLVGLFLFNCAGCGQKEIYTAELTMYLPDGSMEVYPFQYDHRIEERKNGELCTLYLYKSENILYTEDNQVIFYDNNEKTDSFSGTYAIKIID